MFDNPHSDYDVMISPYKKDICKELSDACHKAGLPILWYYLTGDGYDERFDASNPEPYHEYFYNSVEILLTRYGKIAGIWWDGGSSKMNMPVEEVYRMMHKHQPGLISNGRLAGVNTPGLKFETPEQRMGSFNNSRPWETCAVIHDSAWFWNGGKNVKSLNICLRMLIDCAGGDGNLLLDFGPSADGSVEPEVKQRYLAMGDWLKKYGESIYKTRGGPYKPGHWGVSTRRDDTIYLHITQVWPQGRFTLPALPGKVLSCKALTGGDPKFEQTEDHLIITMDSKDHASPDTILELTLDRSAMDIIPIETLVSEPSLTMNAKVAASSSIAPDSQKGSPETVVNYNFESGKITKQYGEDSDESELHIQKDTSMGILFSAEDQARIKRKIGSNHRGHFWRHWKPKSLDSKPWIEVDMGRAQTFSKVEIRELYGQIKAYELQSWDGEQWQTFYEGESVGFLFVKLIEPITAQRVRLQINKTSGASPSLVSFDLF